MTSIFSYMFRHRCAIIQEFFFQIKEIQVVIEIVTILKHKIKK